MEEKEEKRKALGNRLNSLIETLKISKGEFADKAEISQSLISNLLSGKNGPSKATVNLICRTFGVNREWLISGQGDMFESRFKTPFEKEIEGLDVLTPDEGELIGVYRQLERVGQDDVRRYADEKLELQQARESKNEKKITIIQTLEKVGDGDYSSLKKVEK